MIVGFPVTIQPEWRVEVKLNEYNHCIKGLVLSWQNKSAQLSLNHAVPMRKAGSLYWDIMCKDGTTTTQHILSDDTDKINTIVSGFLNGVT